MHKSRLAALVIDCKGDDLDAASAFWSQALGCPSEPVTDPLYVRLGAPPEDPAVLLQKVDHDSRVHIDIETDDLETDDLQAGDLGAKRIAKVKTWWVMEAPTGHRFCIVTPQRAGFDEGATRWE